MQCSSLRHLLQPYAGWRQKLTVNGQLFENFREIFLHRPSGVLELHKRVRPDGAAPFLHRLSGALELRQRVRPFRAESFPLNLSGGFAVCGRRGRCGARRGGKKEGTPAVSLPL